MTDAQRLKAERLRDASRIHNINNALIEQSPMQTQRRRLRQ